MASSKNSKAIDKSAQASTQSNAQSLALQREIYGENKNALAPFMARGNVAGNAYNALLGFNGAEAQNEANAAYDIFKNNTGYQFRLNEGMNALNSGYAGAGVVQSGAAMKGALKYGQDYASNEFGNYLGYLGNQQGVGLSGASALAGVGQGYANNVSNLNSQNAANITNAAVAKANNSNALAGSIAGIASNAAGILSYPRAAYAPSSAPPIMGNVPHWGNG